MSTEGKSLQPLTNGGTVLIVGVKSSNLNDEIRTHPRVTIWDSQQEHWTNKDIPSNVRAIFITRFIGHAQFDKILTEARKKQLTIFNPEGTGMIAKQVRELLALTPKDSSVQEKPMQERGKLTPLHPFIDLSKGNLENARILMVRANELKIDTTEKSLAQMVSVRRRKMRGTAVPKSIQSKLDVSVEILDNMIRELKDMRDFLISTTEENKVLRAKMENFKKLMEL
jgi:hypothetical protein